MYNYFEEWSLLLEHITLMDYYWVYGHVAINFDVKE